MLLVLMVSSHAACAVDHNESWQAKVANILAEKRPLVLALVPPACAERRLGRCARTPHLDPDHLRPLTVDHRDDESIMTRQRRLRGPSAAHSYRPGSHEDQRKEHRVEDDQRRPQCEIPPAPRRKPSDLPPYLAGAAGAKPSSLAARFPRAWRSTSMRLEHNALGAQCACLATACPCPLALPTSLGHMVVVFSRALAAAAAVVTASSPHQSPPQPSCLASPRHRPQCLPSPPQPQCLASPQQSHDHDWAPHQPSPGGRHSHS